MKTNHMISSILMLALQAGVSCGADEAQLQLYGKRIIIYPILAGNPADDDDAWKGAVSMAEYLGLQLERQGMHPSVAPKYSEPLVSEKNISEVAKQLQPPRGSRQTDYILFARFELKQTGDEFVARARAVMIDTTGQVVWLQDPKEFSKGGNIWPIMLCEKLGQTLCATSDLQEPTGEPDPGPFETQLRKKHEARAKE